MGANSSKSDDFLPLLLLGLSVPLDFLEESDLGFPFSTSTEIEVGEFIARVHFLIKSNWQLKANNIIVACMIQVANEGN